MKKLSEVNWDLVKFQFEILGYSLEELQQEYEVSSAVMSYQARNWVQAPASKREQLQFTNLDSIEEMSNEVLAQITDEAIITSLIKQKHFLPKYLELENILLAKAISLAKTLQEERASVSALNTLASVLDSLLKHNPILKAQEVKNEDEGGVGSPTEWKVTVVRAAAQDSGEARTVPPETEEV